MKKWNPVESILWGVVWIIVLVGCLMIVLERDEQTTDRIQEEITYLNLRENSSGGFSFDISANDIINHGGGMLIRSSQQELVVRIQDEILSEYKRSPTQVFGKMPPSKWHVVEVNELSKDQMVTIDYVSCYEKFEHQNPRIYYGTVKDLIEWINDKTLPAWVLGVITVLTGVLAILLYFAYLGKHIVYIACFFITFGLWMIGESKTYFLNYTDLFLQSQITYACVVLMPIFAILYEKDHLTIHDDTPKGRMITSYLLVCLLDACFIFAVVILRIGDFVEYIEYPQIVIGIGILLIFYLENHKNVEPSGTNRWAHRIIIHLFLLSVLIELILINNYGFFYTGIYVKCGILIYVVGRYMMELREMRRQREAQEKINLFLMTDKMKPHFIHNTLVAIQELCYSNPQEAYHAIGIFSKYLRINLEGIGKKQLIPFSKELELIHLYIQIQMLCYEDDIVFQEDVQVEDFFVPPICIQPIIENAIVHGIRKVRRRGKVTLKTWEQGGRIWIQIEDNGIGYHDHVTENKKDGFSSSMAATYRIEKLLNGTWDVESVTDQGTKVTISFDKNSEEE